MPVPIVTREYSPVVGGTISLQNLPSSTQRVTIETPYGVYDALVRWMNVFNDFRVESIRKI